MDVGHAGDVLFERDLLDADDHDTLGEIVLHDAADFSVLLVGEDSFCGGLDDELNARVLVR